MMTSKNNHKLCAILSMECLDDFESYDYLLDKPFATKGWKTQPVAWSDDSIDWNRFDAVLIRSPWDYQDDPELFLQVLRNIENSSAQLENPLQLVLWNINKTYLKDLQNAGIPIVPTQWGQQLTGSHLQDYFQQLDSDEIVIKPVISANADNTFRLNMEQAREMNDELVAVFCAKDFMVQPFMHSVINEGEFSLFFFAGEYSHTILKTPKQNDFRVQEEHGGILLKVEPESQLLKLAREVNLYFSPEPLYSRLDFVRTDGGFAIMEIELIEPSLYFNMDDESAERFARTFDKWMADKA